MLATPDRVRLPGGNCHVPGFRLSLSAFGAGATRLTETPVPAELLFGARFLASARPGPSSGFDDFAILLGRAQLLPNGTPAFLRDPQSDFEYVTTPSTTGAVSRELEVSFDPRTFPAPAATRPTIGRLRLPQSPLGARYLEVGFSLRVGGAVEAEANQCDILDVPLLPRPRKLRLRFPSDEDTVPATFVLLRENDGSEQRRSHRDDLIPNDDFLDIEFDQVFDGFTYSLRMEYAGGRKSRRIFTRKTWAALARSAG